jgi:hypothetical protein
VLQSAIVRVQGPDSALPAALGWDLKGKVSPVLCAARSRPAALKSNIRWSSRAWVGWSMPMDL